MNTDVSTIHPAPEPQKRQPSENPVKPNADIIAYSFQMLGFAMVISKKWRSPMACLCINSRVCALPLYPTYDDTSLQIFRKNDRFLLKNGDREEGVAVRLYN